jgi:hypothetical protein
MLSLLVLITTLAATTLSAPTQTIQERGQYDWSPPLSDFYSAVGNHIAHIRNQPNFPNPPSCDLSKASMPVAPTPLPAPGAGQVLRHVAIGRGTQVCFRSHLPPSTFNPKLTPSENYSCSLASPSVTPAPIGAIASLYNASCIAATYPDLLSMLPNIALQYPVPPSAAQPLSPSNIDLSGHHFFSTNTTPVFNLDTTVRHQYGLVVAKKIANSTAPADAPKGQAGLGNGSVQWLYLTSQDGTTGGLKAVYRINTAGGSPPKTCENMPAIFTVQYASEYWFYGDPVA